MALTPMMRQYLDLKEKNKECLLFFRLGDFYEMFFEDALTASKELDITLTGKDCGLEERAPMCGVPYHAADGYIQKLIGKGYKVAICEQLELPEEAKGLVKRGIIRIVTPGTVFDSSMLKDNENNYILSVYEKNGVLGAAYADISTGAFFSEEIKDTNALQNLMIRIYPTEVLFQRSNGALENFFAAYKEHCFLTRYEDWPFISSNAGKALKEHFHVLSLASFGLDPKMLSVNAAGALLQYLLETQKNSLEHIKKLTPTSGGKYMVIDPFTHRNLELTETMRDKSRKGSLLWLLDKTKTAMGGRLIKRYIEQPLLDKKEIMARLDAVGELKKDLFLRNELRNLLDNIYDIERLLSRISYGSLDARDVLAIRASIQPLPQLKELLSACESTALSEAAKGIDTMGDLCLFLSQSISDDPPNGIRDGGIIKSGFNHDVDKLREARTSGKDWLSSLEQKERESTGIKNLRIGCNKVFGYYIEVTKSNLSLVPYRYTRRQTLAGCERFVTPELKELEEMLFSAEDKCNKLEYELFLKIRSELEGHISVLQANADIIARIDVLQSFAQAAYDYDYVKPTIKTNGVIDIKNGRHPVVERAVRQEFVPNDAYLDEKEDKFLIITGPNMAGKSTFMRQTGLIVLMAQIGCFVPAVSANICIVDRIFTRVGASDDLSAGQSTFMVEMNELASILNNATSKSLLILDEIGRGTSTLDGLSIAWATIEYILGQTGIGAKTLFATHYHELIRLEGILPGVKNYSVGVREFNKTILFLHKIRRGGTDKSFGIEVARLAGLPEGLIERAKALLTALEKHAGTDISVLDVSATQEPEEKNARTETANKIVSDIGNIEINTLTPLEALSILNDFKQRIE